jgi:hypothetical protein
VELLVKVAPDILELPSKTNLSGSRLPFGLPFFFAGSSITFAVVCYDSFRVYSMPESAVKRIIA